MYYIFIITYLPYILIIIYQINMMVMLHQGTNNDHLSFWISNHKTLIKNKENSLTPLKANVTI